MKRPEIFRYHDYQLFVRDWLAYRKASQRGFSLRGLAKQAGLAAGYLSMVQGGQRPLTAKALAKLEPFLGLTVSEYSFLENLLTLGTTDSQAARISALEKMGRFLLYQKHQKRETEVYEYLTHWYYVVIREMASLPDFKPDAQWILSRLEVAVPLKDLKDALDFLGRNGYLEVPLKPLDCSGGVYRVALTQFHREAFDLAAQSIENVPSAERNVQGHTFGISASNFDRAQAIVDEAVRQIRALGEAEKKPDSIYHFQVALFPMTKRSSP